MMSTKKFVLLSVAGVIAAAGGALYATGKLQDLKLPQLKAETPKQPAAEPRILGAAVTVVKAETQDFIERAHVTGSLVAREEIMVGPEIEGLRIVEVLADEGDRVKKGQTLARLVSDTLEAQLAQNTASLAKADAAIAQARSNIKSAEAKVVEAKNALDRGKPLRQSGYLSESVLDQRDSAAKTAEAQLVSSRDGLKVAEAEKAQIEAQRREISWRRSRTEVQSPADGIISRRVARIGGFAAGAADPMFRIIAKGEVELDAEVLETSVAKMKPEQTAIVDVTGLGELKGKVRMVSPEVDRASRLGRVRILLGDNPSLRIGAFARGVIETARSRGLGLPLTAVLFGEDGATVQIVKDDRVVTRRIKTGLVDGGRVEIKEGLAEGDVVVARSGTFLRDGDAVRPIVDASRKVSEVRK
jgi:HlyD family secretion protein